MPAAPALTPSVTAGAATVPPAWVSVPIPPYPTSANGVEMAPVPDRFSVPVAAPP